MEEIRDINIRDLNIQTIPQWAINPPVAVPIYPPVTSQVGIPIINMPGCVESHRDSGENVNLKNEDPDQVKVFCDGEMPSFNAINYDARKLQYTTEQKSREVPPVKSPEQPEAPKPPTPKPFVPKVTPCPEGQERNTSGICENIAIEEVKSEPEIPWQEKYLPTPEAASTTAVIAVTATTSALLAKPLADLLLRVVKPVTKKVLTKIAEIRGKKIRVLSLRERRAEQRDRNQAIKTLRSVGASKKK